MNIQGLSDPTLASLHTAIYLCVVSDTRYVSGSTWHGVREYPDWRKQADQIEAELTKRELPFDPISW